MELCKGYVHGGSKILHVLLYLEAKLEFVIV